MLQLQRASAGSGKTFTLARKFIWYLIAVRENDGRWRLRTRREIADGLSRILAITFTNKATNEMKQRIVEKLADLSRAESEAPLSDEAASAINYLDDFSSELGVERSDVGRAARHALSSLLNEYSDFKVSTIDSFFQTVLRTFAYESNLNDTYQVEIDNDYIATAAVDSTLMELDTVAADSDARFWIETLMKDEERKGSKHWNVFQKSLSDTSIYARLLSAVKRLENEDFKNVRDELDNYFSKDGDPLRQAWIEAIGNIVTPLEDALSEAKEAGRRLADLFRKNHLDPAETGLRYLAGHLRKLPATLPDSGSSALFTPIRMERKTSVFKTQGKGKKALPVASCPDDAVMLELCVRMYDAYSRFLELRESETWRHWKVYAPQIPYVGLIGVTRRMMKEYLDSNNSIQLGETNSMLRRIIGKDDAPFIYERLGSRLNHFLIDEFQDTSRLQWENLYPLLLESHSRGEENLIIGDAKQSIYRFRNADPSLIMRTVPEAFPERIDAGMTIEENTNWRSDRMIVEFNNMFFRYLSDQLSELGKGFIDFTDLYANVEQHSHHQEEQGYIRVSFLPVPEERIDPYGRPRKLTSEEKTNAVRATALSELGPLISSLLRRGYRQSEIALLVRTNSLAKEVIDALVGYNINGRSDDEPRIEFISEESLLVSLSEAVGIIINVLRKMLQGSHEQHEDHPRWTDIRCNFSFYALRHPGLSPAEQVKGFLSETSPVDSINAMLRSMQTVALPALIEAITENFVPLDMRHTQAVFIAGLQDLVLEYCDSHTTDISSFLSWWDAKGVTRSISSPEGTDAVQIMTIHKSKGLEFKCVILPFEDSSLVPVHKSEWKWVRPEQTFIDLGFPPYLPVVTDSSLENTIHAEVYQHFYDLSTMDMLNAYYVAFTRAVSELYIFTRDPGSGKEKGKTLSAYLYRFFEEHEDMTEWNDAHDIACIGILPDVKRRADSATKSIKPAISDNQEESAESETETHIITDYYVDSSPSVLQYVESSDEGSSVPTLFADPDECLHTSSDKTPTVYADSEHNVDETILPDADVTQMPEAEDADPRSEGNLLHGIMSLVKTPDDLHRAVLTYKMRGLITSAQAGEWEEMLAEALRQPEVAAWFTPEWRILNEREVLYPGRKNKRPDRMMISADRTHGIVVDYKFGDIPADNRHLKQLADYILAFRETTHIHNVRGYIWYVRRQRIVPLT